MPILDRIVKGWNAFMGREPPRYDYGYSTSYRPDKAVLSRGVDRTIVTAIYNRIALDVASVDLQHVKVDQNENFKEKYDKSYLSEALTTEANLDQTGREFILDLVLSMFDDGYVAAVPTDANVDIRKSAYDPMELRVGKILQWYPKHVKVRVYNENTGHREDLTLPKRSVAIIQNPLYNVMNQPNSTLQRLIRKLTLLDAIDEQTSVGKLDLIIQLPYVIKTEARREQAEKRRRDIETQLAGSKYGIAYTDGTERITQLNRSLDNNLMGQIEYLTNMLYSQLGISKEVFDGTADEKTMLNYQNRTLTPILTAITEEMTRKFLTKTARSQGQRIKFMQSPFKLVPVSQIADIADKFTRSEILSSNELRAIVGFKPVDDPKADELRNSNLNESADAPPPASTNPEVGTSEERQTQEVPDGEEPVTSEESTDDSEDYSDLGQDFVRMLFSS
jgi:hypothetical protein